MDDLISRKALLDKILDLLDETLKNISIMPDVVALIKRATAADVAPVRHGMHDNKNLDWLLKIIVTLSKNLETVMTERDAALRQLRDADGCFECKFALEGEPCYCEDCKDDPEAQCNESCPWWGDPCGICNDKNCWEWIGVKDDEKYGEDDDET